VHNEAIKRVKGYPEQICERFGGMTVFAFAGGFRHLLPILISFGQH
jgi:hypothetical protein